MSKIKCFGTKKKSVAKWRRDTLGKKVISMSNRFPMGPDFHIQTKKGVERFRQNCVTLKNYKLIFWKYVGIKCGTGFLWIENKKVSLKDDYFHIQSVFPWPSILSCIYFSKARDHHIWEWKQSRWPRRGVTGRCWVHYSCVVGTLAG